MVKAADAAMSAARSAPKKDYRGQKRITEANKNALTEVATAPWRSRLGIDLCFISLTKPRPPGSGEMYGSVEFVVVDHAEKTPTEN
jgi:hypothetical protein